MADNPAAEAERLYQHRVITLLRDVGLLSEERIALLLSWRHSGFSVHNAVRVAAGDTAGIERLGRYLLRYYGHYSNVARARRTATEDPLPGAVSETDASDFEPTAAARRCARQTRNGSRPALPGRAHPLLPRSALLPQLQTVSKVTAEVTQRPLAGVPVSTPGIESTILGPRH